MLAAENGSDPVGICSQIGISVEKFHESFEVTNVVDEFRVIIGELEDHLLDFPLVFLEPFCGAGLEDLSAEHARALVPGVLVSTSWTPDGPDWIGFIGLVKFHAMDLCELLVGIGTEDPDIPRRNVAAVSPPVMLLDVGLIHPLGSQVGRTRLPEVPEGGRLSNPSTLGWLTTTLSKLLIAGLFRGGKLRPQRGIGIVSPGWSASHWFKNGTDGMSVIERCPVFHRR